MVWVVVENLEEVVKLQRQRLIGRAAQLDPLSDFVLIAWDTFKAAEFPFDEARRLVSPHGAALCRAGIVSSGRHRPGTRAAGT